MQARLVWITPDAEKLIGRIARVSNPKNQDNPNIEGLIQYLVRHRHWSPFEMASACVEIETSRAIAAQILRHRSFSFQEFSQRYANPTDLGFEDVPGRKQAEKNRQSSTDDLDTDTTEWWNEVVSWNHSLAQFQYESAVKKGIAKEVARMILPLATTTRMYMSGTVRSWIHYLDLRTQQDTQKEHRDVALAIRDILMQELPIISSVVGWQEL